MSAQITTGSRGRRPDGAGTSAPEVALPLRTTAEKVGRCAPGTRVAGGVRTGDSPSAGWADLLVEIYARRRVEESIVVPAIAEPQVILVLAGTVLAEERELGAGSPWSGRVVTAGEFFLTTTPTPYEVRWRTLGADDYETMHVFIGLPVFARAARAVLGARAAAGGIPALREVFGERDPVLSALLGLLRAEVTASRPASALFLQGLAQSLAVHLLRTYPAQGDAAAAAPRERRGGLPAFKLRRVTDYLEAHLAGEVSLARLAGEAGLSPFHFSRRFKQTTGFSPSQYLVRRRLARARRLLRETTQSVIEVGLEVGYTSPSYFARVFRHEVGVTPNTYRGGNR